MQNKVKNNKAIKYRMYPTAMQAELFAKTFGYARKIWNLMLYDKEECWETNQEILYNTPAQYKKKFSYLCEVDSFALANVQLQLQQAFKNFVRNPQHFGKPKFKSKKYDKKSYTTNWTNGNIDIIVGYVKLPKLGLVKAKIHRIAPKSWKLKSITITQDADGKYYASVLYEYEVTREPTTGQLAIGLDYKSDGLYVDNNGYSPENPHWFRLSQEKLAKLQRNKDKKKKGSKNQEKAQKLVAKLQKHIANRRKDHLHKLSFEIANQYDIVCIEDLNMQAMSNKGFGNGKATHDNGWGMFTTMLSYKLHDRGKILVKVDKWYPSSKTCCHCGAKKDMPLEERIYRCDVCGHVMDRDQNAAVNILKEGLRLLQAS